MDVHTTRFGPVTVEPDDILLFPDGLMAFEGHRHWVLLADAANRAVGWLQSISSPELALGVVSPRRFVPDYQVRVAQSQLTTLQLEQTHEAYVLAIIAKHEDSLAINLKAPLIINLHRLLGRQVIVSDEQPLQYELAHVSRRLRRSA